MSPLPVNTLEALPVAPAPTAIGPVTPGTGPTDLGKAEGGLYAVGDVGVETLAVVDNGTIVVPAVGHYSPLREDLTGALIVTMAGGGSNVTVVNGAGVAAVNVQDGGNSLTVDAPVATPLFARLSDGAAPLIGQKLMAASLPVAIASDQSSLLVNPIVGQAGVQGGSGVVTALTQRVVLATDVPLPAGTNALGSVTVNNAAGVAAVNVQDGGNSITVDAPVGTPVFVRLSDGTIPLVGQKTMALSLPVAIASDQTAVPVSGSVTVSGAVTVTGSVSVTNGTGGAAVNVQDGGNSLTVDALVTAPVFVRLSDGTLPLIGQKTMAGSLPVVIASDQSAFAVSVNNGVGVAAVNVQDGGNSLTVDAPVTAPVFARLSDGAAALIGQKAMAASLPVVLASDQTAVPVSGTVAVSSVIPGTGATNLGKLEGTGVFASGDVGVLLLGVRNDSLAATINATDQNYGAIALDGNGRISIVGTVQAAISTYTQGASGSRFFGIGGVFDDVAPAAAVENRFDVARMSSNRNFYVQVRDGAGNERGLNVDVNGKVGVVDTALETALGIATATGNITAFNQAVTLTLARLSATVGADISGVFTGILAFEVSVDGTSWVAHDTQNAQSDQFVNNAIAPGIFITQVGGFAKMRVRATSFTSGTATITLFDSGGVHIVHLAPGDASIGSVRLRNAADSGYTGIVADPVFTRLSDGAAALIGQKAMAASLPVVIASDQSALSLTAPTTTTGTPAAVTVSTAAVLLKAANASRKSIIITNNSTGGLYIGHTNAVTTTGATMGLLVPAHGEYSDSGFGLYTGDLYGIYSQIASSQNVSISERT